MMGFVVATVRMLEELPLKVVRPCDHKRSDT
jgi:hypothetical protein